MNKQLNAKMEEYVKSENDPDFHYQHNITKWNQTLFSCFQKTTIEKGKGKIHSLDSNDAILLNWIYNTCGNASESRKRQVGDKEYIRIDHEYIREQLFFLKQTKANIKKKLKKLRDFKIIDCWYDENKYVNYYRLNTTIIDLMIYYNNNNKNEVAENIIKLHNYLANGIVNFIDPVHSIFCSTLYFSSLTPTLLQHTPNIEKVDLSINILNNNIYNNNILINYINIIKLKLQNNFNMKDKSNTFSNIKDKFPIPPLEESKKLITDVALTPTTAPSPPHPLNTPPLYNKIKKRKLYTLNKKEQNQLKYITYWNSLAEEQREKKYKIKMSIHKLPNDITKGVSKTVKNVCEMLVDLQDGSFCNQREVKKHTSIPIQTDIEIKRVINDYSKLYISGYSYHKFDIKKTLLMSSMQMFLYNYRCNSSYYATIQKNKVTLINAQLKESIDIPEKIIKKYKSLFEPEVWKINKESIYYKLDALHKFYLYSQKKTCTMYQKNDKYRDYLSTYEKFCNTHIRFIKDKYSTIKNLNHGFLNNDGMIWEKFKKYVRNEYKLVLDCSRKLQISIMKSEKIRLVAGGKALAGEYLGYRLIKNLSVESQKSILIKEVEAGKMKTTDIKELQVCEELKTYILANYEIEDDSDFVPTGSGDIESFMTELGF